MKRNNLKNSLMLITLLSAFIPFIVNAGGVIQLPQTGQTRCYNVGGSVIPCPGTGQDGDIRAGVVWPNPRFTDNGDQTVTDNLTGLVWAKDGNLMKTRDPSFDTDDTSGDGAVLWQNALDYIKKLNQEKYLGYNDWRLPNINELESLYNAEQPSTSKYMNENGFTNVQVGAYWSSTSRTDNPAYAWFTYMGNGFLAFGFKGNYTMSTIYAYMMPVRPGQRGVNPVVSLPSTGQITCYNTKGLEITCSGTGQDGDIRAGVVWPNPRFTANTDETISDNLTGLIWTKDGNVMKTRDPGFDADYTFEDGAVTWQHALDYIKKLNQENYLGYNDWRLPNRKEIRMLTHYGQLDTYIWLNSQGFTNVKAGSNYWLSSNLANYPKIAWFSIIGSGFDGYLHNQEDKSNPNLVWPVRSGQIGTFYNLVIAKLGTGDGTVTSNPLIVNCGSNCSDKYHSDTLVTLTATPDAGSTFTGWSGACSGTDACTVTMDEPKTVNANFLIKTYTITATTAANGTTSQSVTVNHGASPIFTFTPNTGYNIADVLVDGTSVGAVSSYTFNNVTASQIITATFILKGDVDMSSAVNLTDAILALQTVSSSQKIALIHKEADVDGDNRIGMAEAIYALQCIARLRNNHSPALNSIGNKTIDEGSTLSFTVSATDADNDSLTFETSPLPNGATFNTSTKTFSWTPTYSQSSTYQVTFTANDGYGGIDSKTITITVNDAVQPLPPNAPSTLISTNGNAQATISWPPVMEATSYNIYWSLTSGVNKISGTKISNVTSPYIHTGLSNGATYYYVITASNAVGESAESNQLSANPSNLVGLSRSNPSPRSQVLSAPNWDIKIVETIRGNAAWQAIKAANQFNDPAPTGMEYLLVKIHAKSKHTDDLEHSISKYDFSITGDHLIDNPYASVVSPKPSLDADLFGGGETEEGWAPYIVGIGEGKLILILDELYNFNDNDLRFIAIDDGASISVDPGLANIAPTNIGNNKTSPALLTQKVTNADWEVTVLEAIRGDAAWVMVHDANQFNSPPASGREYVATKIHLRYIGTIDKSVSTSTLYFRTTGNLNVLYDHPSVVDPTPKLEATLFPGGEYEGWVVTQVAKGETGIMLVIDMLYDSAGVNRRFASLVP